MKWAICTIFLLLAAARAAEFEISDYQESFPEGYVNHRTRIREPKLDLSFEAPKGWFRNADPAARRFTLQSPTNQLVFTIHLTTNAFPAKIENFKESLTNSFSNLLKMEAYQTASGSGPGLAADLKHRVGGAFSMNTRVAWFPIPDGTAEISFASPTLSLEDVHNLWAAFVGSFRIEAAKK